MREDYIWGYEKPFQVVAEMKSRDCLEASKVSLNPKVMVFGVEVSSDACSVAAVGDLPETVCPDELGAGILDSLRKLKAHTKNATAAEKRPVVGNALRDVFADHFNNRDTGRASFASWPVGVGGKEVICVLQVDQAVLGEVPSFSYEANGRIVVKSLPHMIITLLLEMFQAELSKPEPGRWWETIPFPDELVRRAGRYFMYEVAYALGMPEGTGGLFNSLTEISVRDYEKRAGRAVVALAARDVAAALPQIKLSQDIPASIGDPRTARKLAEAAGESLRLVTDTVRVYGLAEACSLQDETIFTVRFTGRGTWELSRSGTALMTVTYCMPTVPGPLITTSGFEGMVAEAFVGAGTVDVACLYDLCRGCIEQRRGAILVITSSANDEASRLATCFKVEPFRLDVKGLLALSSIDGAVLVDLQGQCHGFGAILDGATTPGESRDRGARHNSCARYVQVLRSRDRKALVIAASEDGGLTTYSTANA